jgi:TP901 family phage tail tape measure protein
MARKLIVEVIGDSSSLEAALGRSAAASTGFVGKLKASSAEMASVGASLTRHLTLPIVAIGAAGTKMAVDFQASMELLHTQAGIAQSSIANLSKGVLALAGPTATAPDVLAAGLYHLSSQGLRGAQSLHALQVAAEGAKMGGANLEDVTNALGAVLASKIAGVHSYEQAMGQLNATVGAGDMRMQDLADAMGTGLPAKAAVAGVSLKDVSAALATFGDNNIRGAEAGTLLNSTMRLMEGPSKAAAKAMGQIGLNAADLGNTLRNQGIVAALELLKSKLDALPKEEQVLALTRMFGGRQSGGVQILIDQLGRLKQKEQEVAAGGNSFAADWGAYTQTAAYKMDQLGASMRAAGISIGDILLPFVSKAADALSSLAGKFQALPGPVKDFILASAGVVAVVGPVISTVGKLGQALAFLAANPVVLVVAAIAALGAAMAAAVLAPQKLQSALEGMGLSAQTSGRIVADLQDAFHVVQSAADVLVNVIRSNWGTISNIIRGTEQIVSGVVTLLEAAWREFGSNIITQATLAWNLVKATIQNALTVIEGVVNVFAGILHGNWSQVWSGIKQIASGTWNEIVALFRNELGTLENLAGAIGKGIQDGVLRPLERLGADLLKKLEEGVNSAIHTVVGLAERLAEAIGSAIVTGVIGGMGNLVSEVGSKLKSGIEAAVHFAGGLLHGSGEFQFTRHTVGAPMAQGIVDGTTDGLNGFGTKLSAKLKKEAAQALAIAQSAPEIHAAAEHIGISAAMAVVDGVVGIQPSMTQQIKTALTQAVQQAAQAAQSSIQTFQSGFSSMAQGILSAFSQQTSNFVAPAQKLLDKMQAKDQLTNLQQNLASASDAVKQAQTALDNYNATAGGTADQLQAVADATTKVKLAQDAYNAAVTKYGATSDQALKAGIGVDSAQSALAKAQAAVGVDPAQAQQLSAALLQAQQQYTSASRAIQEYDLQLKAAKQTAAYDKERAKQQEQLAKQLAALEKGLSKQPGEWDKMSKKVLALLDKYGVPLYQSGQKFVDQFASGIRSEISSAEKAAHDMAEAVSKYIPKSPAKTGPLAFSSQAMGQKFGREFATGISQGLYNGQGLGSIAGAFSSIGSGLRSSSLPGAPGSSVNVNVNVSGSVVGGSPREIADELKYPIRDALLTIARSEPSIFHGRA